MEYMCGSIQSFQFYMLVTIDDLGVLILGIWSISSLGVSQLLCFVHLIQTLRSWLISQCVCPTSMKNYNQLSKQQQYSEKQQGSSHEQASVTQVPPSLPHTIPIQVPVAPTLQPPIQPQLAPTSQAWPSALPPIGCKYNHGYIIGLDF